MEEIFNKLGINFNFQFSMIFATLIYSRLISAFAVVPFLFGRPVPKKVVIGAAMVIAMFLYPLLKPEITPVIPSDLSFLFVLYLKEIFIGLCIGFAVSMMFFGFDSAGRMIDNQRGASIARVLIPQLGDQGSIMSQLLFQMSIVLYITFGGHVSFLRSFFEGFLIVPVLEFPNVQPGLYPLMIFLIILTGQVLVLSIQIAAPVIIAILIADIVLGITNRLAPQINVWELGFNIRGVIGIIALFLSITVIAHQMERNTMSNNKVSDKVMMLLSGSIPDELKNIEIPAVIKSMFLPTGEVIEEPSIWDKTLRALPKSELLKQ